MGCCGKTVGNERFSVVFLKVGATSRKSSEERWSGCNGRGVFGSERSAGILEREVLQRPENPMGVSGMKQDREAMRWRELLRG
jgi:hypothetical protein